MGRHLFGFEIEGSLAGYAAWQVDQAWRTASSVIGSRALIVVVGNVTSVDSIGRELLLRFHEAGAQLVAKSPKAKALVPQLQANCPYQILRLTKNQGLGRRSCDIVTGVIERAWEYGSGFRALRDRVIATGVAEYRGCPHRRSIKDLAVPAKSGQIVMYIGEYSRLERALYYPIAH